MLSDAQLLNQWQTHRDSEAFAEIVQRYSGLVYGAARRILGDAAEAEDIAQECFLKLSRIDNEDTATSLGGWLHTVAINRAIDRQRSEKRRTTREKAFSATTEPTSQELQEWRELESHIDAAIAELPDDLRAGVIAHFIGGDTHKIVAKQLGISRSAATRRIQKGVDALREKLKARGIEVTSATLAAGLTHNLVEAAPAVLQQQLRKIAIASSIDRPASLAASAAPQPLVGKPGIVLAGLVTLAVVGFFTYGSIRPDTPPTANASPPRAVSATVAPQLPPSNPSAQILVAQTTDTEETASAEATTDETASATEVESKETPFTLRTVTADGEPVAGAETYVLRYTSTAPMMMQPGPSDRTTEFAGPFFSDDDGITTFDFVPTVSSPARPQPTLALSKVAGKFIGAWRSTQEQVDARRGEIKLVPSKSVRGTVQVPDGFSPANVTVSILSIRVKADLSDRFGAGFAFYNLNSPPDELVKYSSTKPDVNGTFEFHDLPTQGGVYLEAIGPGLGRAQVMELDLSRDFEPTFAMEPEGQISGEIRWAGTNQPAQGVRVTARPSGRPAVVTYEISATTDNHGRYLFSNLMENAYNVKVPNTHPEEPWVSTVIEKIEVKAGELAEDISLYLEAGALQQGWVRFEDNDEPVAEVGLVALVSGMGGESVGSAFTDEQGFFQIRVPSGESMLYVAVPPTGIVYPKDQGRQFITLSPGTDALAPLTIKVKRDGDPIDYTKKAYFTGRVLDTQGNGLAGVGVGYGHKYKHGEDDRQDSGYSYGRTDKNGRYKLEVMVHGSYQILAGGEKYSTAKSNKWYTPEADQTYTIEDFTVKEYTATIEFHVANTEGVPIKGVMVWPNPKNYRMSYPYPTTDLNGKIKINNVPTGTFSVSFRKEGYKDFYLDFESNASYDVTLEEEIATEE